MKKISFLWTFIILFSSITSAMAETKGAIPQQDPLKMEELTIQILPEYSYHPKSKNQDTPPLLVGYHGSLINNTDHPLKGKIEIPLPIKEADFKLGFVADYSADLREMNEIEYTLNEKTGVISWETSREIEAGEMYKFVIEYYTNNIVEKDGKKFLEYTFTNFAHVGLLNIIFVEPLKTDSFKLEPASETHQKNSYNMNMFLYQANGMKPGEEKKIKLVYEKQDDRTTAEIMEEMAGKATQQGTTTKKNEESIPLPLIIGVLGGTTILAFILLIYVLNKRKNVSKDSRDTTSKEIEIKKTKLRKMLIDGLISEEEYQELLTGMKHKEKGEKKI